MYVCLELEVVGLRSGFETPYLERPGRQLHQQGLSETRLGYWLVNMTALDAILDTIWGNAESLLLK